jgi:type IV secretion system protein VirB2
MNEGITVAVPHAPALSTTTRTRRYGEALLALALILLMTLPEPALAQASPFSTGTTSFSTNLLAILTPLAVVAIMVLGVLAWFDIINWRWVTGAFFGVVLVFGAPQIVAWVRGLFGV